VTAPNDDWGGGKENAPASSAPNILFVGGDKRTWSQTAHVQACERINALVKQLTKISEF
jgi:hypothetical protein